MTLEQNIELAEKFAEVKADMARLGYTVDHKKSYIDTAEGFALVVSVELYQNLPYEIMVTVNRRGDETEFDVEYLQI